jgi:dipeptidyl aminopeptidase/acylaminoacyl peptidase
MFQRVGLSGIMIIIFLLASASVLAQAPVAPPAKSAKIDVAEFARLPFLSRPKMSPDGSSVAAMIAVNGEKRFGIIPLNGEGQKFVVIGISNETEIDSYRWLSDDWIVASLSGVEKVPESPIPFRVSRLVSISRDGKTIHKLNRFSGGYADEIVHMPSDGSTIILVSTQDTIYSNYAGVWPRVMEIDVATGKNKKTRQSGREPIRDWYADAAGNIRMGYGFDYEKNQGKYIYRPSVSGNYRLLDKANYNKDEDLLSPLLFTTDPNKIIVWDTVDNRDGIYEYDITTQTNTKMLYSSLKYPIDDVIIANDKVTIIGVEYTDDRSRVEWLDSELKNMQLEIEKAVPGRFVTFSSWDRLRRQFIVHIGSTQDPGRYYFFSLDEGVLKPFAWLHENLRGKTFAAMTAVSYKARDGLEIPSYLTLPVDRTDKNLPLIVLPHGGPWARDQLQFDSDVQFLANRGYAVLQPNYRGSSGYGREYSKKSEGQWGLSMQDDITDGVKWLVEKGVVDPKRVCIMGGSYGGYAAMIGTVRDPDLYKCAISFAGISDLPELLNYDRNFLYYKGQKKSLKGDGADLRAVSAINNIGKIKTPLLLIHGKKDLRVPVAQSTRLAAALNKAGKSVEIYIQDLGDHNLSREADRLQYYTVIDAFLAKHNPSD